MASSQIFQYNVLSALMHGLCSDGFPLAHILQHGEYGLGTVAGLEGEMLILNGEALLFKQDGSVRVMREDEVIPWAMTTRFIPSVHLSVHSLNLARLATVLIGLDASGLNHFHVIQITGFFESMTFRIIPPQQTPDETLLEASKRQTYQTNYDLQGTLFGFWSPEFTAGISLPGLHLHFISADKLMGGHVLEFFASSNTISIASTNKYSIELPTTAAFCRGKIPCATNEDVHRAEGSG
ncbi:alpha-acetolactate decarboxylase [Penicillium atrosanguineum]|uniref:Alpha-acetolactate decarboxylase n=1 Tax=Penicillium atrosanguineum TaxID=1132637 RepID=A0A9W9Q5A8_9EURO|nr:alpha-acetolactate decarboxylase [Penicillium atrosanguineum]KAJ5148771.1 alpha-acetolactate decarboxylase [Penicillium atrosanguineum]KAJ5323562.1 alpha-acetolactate decarboxylase [Penicillium atrosanguineum]